MAHRAELLFAAKTISRSAGLGALCLFVSLATLICFLLSSEAIRLKGFPSAHTSAALVDGYRRWPGVSAPLTQQHNWRGRALCGEENV